MEAMKAVREADNESGKYDLVPMHDSKAGEETVLQSALIRRRQQ